MVKEAEVNKEADDKRKADADTRNEAQQLIDTIDRQLADTTHPIDENTKAQATKIRDEIKAALDKNDLDTIRARIAELQQAANAMYQAQAQTPNAGETKQTSSDPNDPNVVDATYTEKKNDDK